VISFTCKKTCKVQNARNNISLRNCVVIMFIRKRYFMVVVEICVHESLNIKNSDVYCTVHLCDN